MVNILDKIRNDIDSFSKGQKKTAYYILENSDDAAFMTAAEIGKAAGVSESTVVRFAKTIGFDGFPEFQKEIAFSFREKFSSVKKLDISECRMNHSKILECVLKNDVDNIKETLKMVDVDAFTMAADLISEARKVYIVAVRSAAPLASFLAFYLRISIDNVVEVTSSSSSEILEQMIGLTERDVVIGISFPRYSMRTLKAMEFANSRNAMVISITDGPLSPMNLYSSCNLFAKSSMASVVESITAPMSVINALIIAVCIKNSRKVVQKLEELKRVWDDYDECGSDEINYLDEKLMKDLKGLK